MPPLPESPPGFVAVPLKGGCVCLIPERVFVAGLPVGKTLRRQEAMEQRSMTERDREDVFV